MTTSSATLCRATSFRVRYGSRRVFKPLKHDLMTTVKESEGVESEYDEAADGMEVDELQSEGEKVRTRSPGAFSPTIVPHCLSRLF